MFILLLVLAGTFARGVEWWRRRRGRTRIAPADLVRETRDAGVRIHLFKTRAFHGMRPGKAHAAKADLLLAADRFVLSSNRGVLADVGRGKGRPFRSVRCTGPGRLVIEGDTPRADGTAGLYRFDIAIEEAGSWAAALQPFVAEPVVGAPHP